MITREMKVSEVLAQYPQTLDVFVEVSPAFAKLKNPLLRKMLASRVTLEQAAKIANLAPETLVTTLNRACGLVSGPDVAAETDALKPAPVSAADERPALLDKLAPGQLVLVDVREDIAHNVDPFKKIMTAVKQLQDGQVMHLVNVFEPVPLYDVLGHRGLKHWSEQIGKEWHVYFYSPAADGDATGNGQEHAVSAKAAGTAEKLVELDVSGLEPPEPMMRILATLPTLDEGTALVVHHHREPKLLYSHLEERGYEWETTQLGEESYRIVIRLKGSD